MSRKSAGERYRPLAGAKADIDLLARLVEFAAATVPPLSAQCLATLRDLLLRGPWTMLKLDLRRGLDVPTSEVVQFHAELRERLEQLVELRDSDDGMMPSVRLESLQFMPAPALDELRVGYSKTAAQILVTGTVRDRLWLQTLTLLPAAGIGRLMRCECGRTFAKTGRREFCSPRCQRRVYMRARRAEERAQATKGLRHAKTRKR